MSKSVERHWHINDNRHRITVGISNQAEGVVARVFVSHVENKHGYTTLKHERFKDYAIQYILTPRALRVTKKLLNTWLNQLENIYQTHLPTIQNQYS